MITTIKKVFVYVFEMIMDLFFAPRCLMCDKYIEDRNKIFCEDCAEALKDILAVEYSVKKIPHLKKVLRITKYRGGTREMLLKLKFEEKLSFVPIIKNILISATKKESKVTELLSKVDIATAVPLHMEREKERGYNQVELIFGEWLEEQHIKMDRLLQRTKATKHLFELSPNERRKEITDAFAPIDDNKIKGKRILVLDDIFTTGTTMSECAKILLENGAVEVYGLVFASDSIGNNH